jgi:hypothetical protein
MNPLTAIPAKARLYVYAVLGLGSLALAAWQASDGDWLVFVGLLLGMLGFGTAASNVDLPRPDDGYPDDDEDDEEIEPEEPEEPNRLGDVGEAPGRHLA